MYNLKIHNHLEMFAHSYISLKRHITTSIHHFISGPGTPSGAITKFSADLCSATNPILFFCVCVCVCVSCACMHYLFVHIPTDTVFDGHHEPSPKMSHKLYPSSTLFAKNCVHKLQIIPTYAPQRHTL